MQPCADLCTVISISHACHREVLQSEMQFVQYLAELWLLAGMIFMKFSADMSVTFAVLTRCAVVQL